MPRSILFEGRTVEVPNDATDDETVGALSAPVAPAHWYKDPDAFVRHIGELFDLAALGDDTPGNTERAIHAIALAARGGISGATAGVVDHAIVCIAQAIGAVGEHFADQISTTDTELALRSAGGILRTFTAHLHASDRPPALEYEMWVDGVSIFYHQLRIADLTRRVLARGRKHNLGKTHAPAAPSSMH